MCYCDIDNLPTWSKEVWHKARKQHTCYECGSPIDPGERYRYIFGIWDGKPSVFKHCEVCANLWDQVVKEYECICYGSLWELITSTQ